MTLGLAPQPELLVDPVDVFCGGRLGDGSVYGLLHRERDVLFPDEMFGDLFTRRGRRSIPPSVVATVMVLARLEGLSDVEAMDRFIFDARWRHACGVGGWEDGLVEFDRTVLVRFRMRLAASGDPDRIFRRTVDIAGQAGLIGVKRVLDSAPLFDAVATMDTVTLIRSAIRGLLKTADADLEAALRTVVSDVDDYVGAGKPVCDWNDAKARAAVVDRLACDGLAMLTVIDGQSLPDRVAQAAELVAVVIGQDLECDDDGIWRIVRGVAPDRVISTVDPEARHGRKSTSGKFDGYKGHAAIDPDCEIITDAAAGPANAGDGAMTGPLTRDLDPKDQATENSDTTTGDPTGTDSHDDEHEHHDRPDDNDGDGDDSDNGDKAGHDDSNGDNDNGDDSNGDDSNGDGDDHDGDDDGHDGSGQDGEHGPTVYGDAAYGSGDQLAELADRGIDAMVKTQPPSTRRGMFTKDDFDIDVDADAVTCPQGHTAPIRRGTDGAGKADFARHCTGCPLRDDCTTSKRGRTVSVHRHEKLLARQRERCRDPDWLADYRATRPKVERKLAHLVRRGRRTRHRGLAKVNADWNLAAAAANVARIATLGLFSRNGTWQPAPT